MTGLGIELIAPISLAGYREEHSFRQQIRFQMQAGADFLVAGGVMPDTLALREDQYLRLVAVTLEEAQHRIPVIAEVGPWPLAVATDWARAVESLGVAGVLLTAPHRSFRTQRELHRYATAMANAISVPLTLRNDPVRNGINWDPETLRCLVAENQVNSVLEASGSVRQMLATVQMMSEDFLVLSTDDHLAVTRMAMGAQGVISAMAHQLPFAMKLLTELCQRGEIAAAAMLHQQPATSLAFRDAEPSCLPATRKDRSRYNGY